MLDPCDGRRAHWSANSFHILNDNTMLTSIHRRLRCYKAHRYVKQSSILTRWQFFCSLCDRFNWESLSRNRNSPAAKRANWIWSNLSLPCRLLSSLYSIMTKTVSCILVRLIIEMLAKCTWAKHTSFLLRFALFLIPKSSEYHLSAARWSDHTTHIKHHHDDDVIFCEWNENIEVRQRIKKRVGIWFIRERERLIQVVNKSRIWSHVRCYFFSFCLLRLVSLE